MNILRTAALVGLSTLVLSACANNPYASSRAPAYHGGVYTQHPSTYPSQPRVIIAQQPHRQVYSQGSRIYTQPHQVQQYNYYPGHQYQQPRHHQQQRPNHYQHPRYTQQRNPYVNKYDTRPQHQRPNHQRYEQYQRPPSIGRIARSAFSSARPGARTASALPSSPSASTINNARATTTAIMAVAFASSVQHVIDSAMR